MSISEFDDRVGGCVLGLALGDALGAPFEFHRATEVPDPIPALEMPWRGGPAGSITDDTEMARNLVRSLVERGGFDPDDIVRRHVDWLRRGPPHVGTLTGKVLRRVAAALNGVGPPRPARLAQEFARSLWEERGPEVSAGNGSVMYSAPLGACYANRPEALSELAPRLSALTHFDERCRTAVLAVTVATAASVRGESRTRAVSLGLEAALPRQGGEELEFLIEAVGSARAIDGPDQGFCLFAAAAGLQALGRGGGFEEEIRRVVSLGGDTDTNAAVAGALVGASVGAAGLPQAWLARLTDAEAIEDEARELAKAAARI